MVKVALVAPAGMVTLAGTEATAGLLLTSATTVPDARAGSVTCTVSDDGVPPNVGFTWLGGTSSRASVVAGRLSTTSTVIVTLWLSDPLVAVTVSGKLPSGAVLSALSWRVVSVPKIVSPNPSVPRVVLLVMVVEAGVCEVTPAGRPLSWKFTVPRKPLSGIRVSTCRIVLTHDGLSPVFGWASPPVQLLLLPQVCRPPRTR